MAAHGHTPAWDTYIGVGRTTQAHGWCAQVKAWLSARHDAKRSTLNAYWDAQREAVRSFRADAAIDMVPSVHLDATARAYCDLAL